MKLHSDAPSSWESFILLITFGLSLVQGLCVGIRGRNNKTTAGAYARAFDRLHLKT